MKKHTYEMMLMISKYALSYLTRHLNLPLSLRENNTESVLHVLKMHFLVFFVHVFILKGCLVFSSCQDAQGAEEREALARMAANVEDAGSADSEAYIEKYLRSVLSVENILTLDRLRQVCFDSSTQSTVWQCKCFHKCFIRLANQDHHLSAYLSFAKCACGKRPKKQMQLALQRCSHSTCKMDGSGWKLYIKCTVSYGILSLRSCVANYVSESSYGWC